MAERPAILWRLRAGSCGAVGRRGREDGRGLRPSCSTGGRFFGGRLDVVAKAGVASRANLRLVRWRNASTSRLALVRCGESSASVARTELCKKVRAETELTPKPEVGAALYARAAKALFLGWGEAEEAAVLLAVEALPFESEANYFVDLLSIWSRKLSRTTLTFWVEAEEAVLAEAGPA